MLLIRLFWGVSAGKRPKIQIISWFWGVWT